MLPISILVAIGLAQTIGRSPAPHFVLGKPSSRAIDRKPNFVLNYPMDPHFLACWFYNEVTVHGIAKESQISVCGFAHGSIGFQIDGSSPDDARLYFEVQKYNNNMAPKVVGKGDGVTDARTTPDLVFAERPCPLTPDKTYRFLIGANSYQGHTIYTGYFYDPKSGRWILIASVSAPGADPYIEEPFSSADLKATKDQVANVNVEYSEAWVGTSDGKWRSLWRANVPVEPDAPAGAYSVSVSKGKFIVRYAGDEWASATPPGTTIIRKVGTSPPNDLKLPPITVDGL